LPPGQDLKPLGGQPIAQILQPPERCLLPQLAWANGHRV
jgi:hypothetical protein